MKVKKAAEVIVASVATVAMSVSTAFAQITTDLPDTGVGDDLLQFIKDALNLAIGLSALVAVAVLVYSGVQYIVASGDEGKIEKATRGITYAVIGLVIAFISVLIVNFVLQKVLNQGA